MAIAWLIVGIVLVWYCSKAIKMNPEKPNWSKALVAALFWPFSIFTISWSKEDSKKSG